MAVCTGEDRAQGTESHDVGFLAAKQRSLEILVTFVMLVDVMKYCKQ